MKMKHKRIWALMMAVVLVLTAVFFDVPSRLKAESQAETSEVMLADVEEAAATEETIDEAIPDEEVATEVTEEMTEDIVDEVTEDTSEDMTEETTEVVEETEDTTIVTNLFDAILDLEEDIQTVYASGYELNVNGTIYTVSVDSNHDPLKATITSGPYASSLLHCNKTIAASPFSWDAEVANTIIWSISSSSQSDILGAYWDRYRGNNPNIDTQSLTNLESFSRDVLSTITETNNRTYNGITAPLPEKYYMNIGKKPSQPNKVVSGSTIKTTLDQANNIQKTDIYYLSTNDANKIVKQKFTIPAGVTLNYSTNSGTTWQSVTGPTTKILDDANLVYFSAPITTSGTLNIKSEAVLQNGAQACMLKNVYFLTPDRSFAGATYGIQTLSFVTWESPSYNFNLEMNPTGSFTLKKVNKTGLDPIVVGSDYYSLSGAVYGVYESKAAATNATNTNRGNIKYTLTTDTNGNTSIIDNIPAGTKYYIKELIASKGYTLDTTVHEITVTAANTHSNPATVTSQEVPKIDPLTIILTKKNDNKVVVPNAKYEVKFYKTSENANITNVSQLANIPVDKRYVFKTNSDGKITFSKSSEFLVEAPQGFYEIDGILGLPCGTLTIQEISAEGHEVDPTIYIKKVTPGENISMTNSNVRIDVKDEHQFRGDVSFTKKDDNGTPLANVKFEIKSVATGESHIVWTDENGFYSTSYTHIEHTHNTNGGEQGDGVWFGDLGLLAKHPTWGALPSGSYIVTELRCPANENKYKNIEPIPFKIDTEGQLHEIGDMINYPIKITTTAKNPVTDTNVAAIGSNLELVDTVDIEGLEINHSYTLKCKIYSKKDNDFLKDTNGNVYEKELPFVATQVNDSKDVTVTIDIDENFAGQDIVFYEYLYDAAYSNEVMAQHASPDYEEQTIHFIKIGTQAKDAVSESQMGLISEKSTIIDTCFYENVVPNKSYVLRATLMDTDKNEPIIQDGKPIVVEHQFTPSERNGKEDVTITFNSNVFTDGGTTAKSVTVFEEIFYNDYSLALEDDITSQPQSIKYPVIRTTAKDKVTDSHEALAGTVVVVDKVQYWGLLPDKEYEAVGTLKYTTGEDVIDKDGNKITSSTKFFAKEPNGTVDVVFEFDASLLEGETICIFEDVKHLGKNVAVHHSLSDELQRIKFPRVITEARDSISLTHEGRRSHTSVIEDEVSFSNVTVGDTYQVVGWLVDAETGEVFKGEGGMLVQDFSEPFVAKAKEDKITMSFNVDSIPLVGKSLVVYEELYHIYQDDEGNTKKALVAQHKNKDDKGQTVTYDSFEGTLTLNCNFAPGEGDFAMPGPGTGDNSKPYLFFGIMVMCGCAITVLAIKKRRKEDNTHEED